MNKAVLKAAESPADSVKPPVWMKGGPFLFFTILFVIFFSPVIFNGRLLAPTDGLLYGIPAFYSPRTLWTPLIYAGYPVAADPQVQTWYPLSFLWSLVPGGWNAFIVSVYVLSACFAYGYVRTLTQSRMAGLVSGLGFSMSGFMMARLGQTPLAHSALWLPLIFWAIEKLRREESPSGVGWGALGVACFILAGHPQMFLYGMMTAAAYTLYVGWLEPQRRRFFGRVGLMTILGVGLTAVQLLPTMELAGLSTREEITFSEFSRYSLSPLQSLSLLFPFLFGGGGIWYSTRYFGEGNFVEMVGYLGLLTLLLAAVGVVVRRGDRQVRFWLAVVGIGWVLSLGKFTPLGEWLYHLPVYNKFRGQIRHFLEISLAVSVLAGFGAAAILHHRAKLEEMKNILFCGFALFGTVLCAVFIFSGDIKNQAALKGLTDIHLAPWNNPAVGVPVIVFILSVVSVWIWFRKPSSALRQSWVLMALVVDLGSFGWFHHWNYLSPPAPWLNPPGATSRFQGLLEKHHQRMVPITGVRGENHQFPVNLSRMWGIPSISGYGPLVLRRLNNLLSLTLWGSVEANWSSPYYRGLDILGVRYIFLPESAVSRFQEKSGMQWSEKDMGIHLGGGCGMAYPESVRFQIPEGFTPTQIGVVGRMICSADIADGQDVLDVEMSRGSRSAGRLALSAGGHLSEWAYDCPSVRPSVRHQKAEVYQSFVMHDPSGGSCQGHQYVARLPVNVSSPVDQIQLTRRGGKGTIQLDKISLVDETSGRTLRLDGLTAGTRWNFQERISRTHVYENTEVMPRAWLVSEVLAAPPEKILHALQHSVLPDGRMFDPARTALIEDSSGFPPGPVAGSGQVEIIREEDTVMEWRTRASSDSFLVMSDVYYPGWKATVDGQAVSILRTDYVLRGIPLPAGSHVVRMEYVPRYFYAGLGVTLFSLLILVFVARYPVKARPS